MSINSILNTIIINDQIATSGQPSPVEFDLIADDGFSTVFNLAMPDSDNALPDEGGFVSEAGMSYIHLPVPFDAPTQEHLTKFIRFMKALDGEKVWVHCALNYRVSAFMYHYQRTVLKIPEKGCVAMIEEWQPDDVWKTFLQLEISET